MEMEKSKVLIQFLLIFRQSGDVLFFLYARRLRGYTATQEQKKLIMTNLNQQDMALKHPNKELNISYVKCQNMFYYKTRTICSSKILQRHTIET